MSFFKISVFAFIWCVISATQAETARGWCGDIYSVQESNWDSFESSPYDSDFNMEEINHVRPLNVGNEMMAAEPLFMTTTMEQSIPQQVVNQVTNLAAALQNDPQRIYEYVRNHIELDLQMGWWRSAERTLIDGIGTVSDQAVLLVELLRAAGYTDAEYVYGSVTLPFSGNDGYNMQSWLGASSVEKTYLMMKAAGVKCEVNESETLFTFPHVWVTVTIEGQQISLDPSIKPHKSWSAENVKFWMGYDRNALLSAAGGTTDVSSVWGLDESSLHTKLTDLTSDLIQALHTNAPAHELSKVFGGRSVIAESGLGEVRFTVDSATVSSNAEMTNASPYIVFEDTIYGGFFGKLFPDLGTSPLTLKTYDIIGYPYRALMYLGGEYFNWVALSSDSITVQIGIPGYNYSEEAGWGIGYRRQFETYPIPHLATIAVPLSIGNSRGKGVLRLRSAELENEINSNGDIIEAALHAAGASYMQQKSMAHRIANGLFADLVNINDGYCGGFFVLDRTDQDTYFIDLKHAYQRWVLDANTADCTAAYQAPFFLASAMEHGVLEQTQPEYDAVSTIRVLGIASRSNQRIFRATSNNWSSVRSNLNGYETQTLVDLDALMSGVSTQTFVLPENGQIAANSWTGSAYIAATTEEMVFDISGLDGGYNTGGAYDPQDVYLCTKLALEIYNKGEISHALSDEPVDLVTGAYVFDHDDLSVGGALPLTLSRHYSSKASGNVTSIGAGWSHSFDMQVNEFSNPQIRLRSSEDAAAFAVGLVAIQDLKKSTDTAKGWLTEALIAEWVMDQLTGHTVSIVAGQKTYDFVQQPDGSYTPPPGMTVSLTKTNGVFVMQERNANTYTFNTNNLIAEISDPDDNTVAFSYDTQTQTSLQAVTNSFGQMFSFSYTDGLLTSVTDNSSPSRTVYYRYDSDSNLTNFVDAAGSSWGIAYNDANHPNAITSLTDPEEIVTIQNFYNSLGIVTQQVSATSSPWNFYIAGFQSVEEDPLGNRTLYEFDEKGRTLSIQDAQSNRTTRVYDGQNHVTNIVDAEGVTNIFVYDRHHNLLEQTAAAGMPEEVVTAYGYDAQHHLRFITNAVGTAEQTVTEMTYTGTHHVDTITEAKGTSEERTTDYDYNSDGLVEQVSEGSGRRVTTYSNFDSYGNARTINATDAGTISRTFNARGDLKTLTLDGKTTVFGHNALRLPTVVTNALGTADQTVTSQSYYDNALLKTFTDARDKATHHYWTPAYKPAGTVFPDLGNTTNLYDQADRLFAARDAEGNWVTNTLDAVGRPVSVSSVYSVVSNQFDAAGNLTNSIVDPSGLNLWSRSEYDNLNRLKKQQSAIGTQQFFYDPLGRTTNRMDQASKHWKTEFDSLGRVKKTFRPSENFEEYGHDALGNRTHFWNADRKPVTFGVDAQGRVTSITNAIGKVTSFTFDDAGNLTDREDAKNEITHYDYDALKRMTNIVHESVWKASFVHDANGNIVEHASPLAQIQFGYDKMNRLTASTQSVYSVSSVVQNQYDLNGNRTNIVYPGGLEVAYTYGADNRLESVTTEYTENTETISFGYDTANRLDAISYPNGVNSTFGYDAEDRITSIQHGSFVDRTIQRNALGFKHTELIDAGLKPTVPDTRRSIKTHNDADQLVSERIQTAVTNWTEIDYIYNNNGGLDTVMPANEASTSYTYDYDNRLICVDSGNSRSEYILDAGGSRIGRIHTNGTSAVTNYFVVDYVDGLKRPLAETDAAGNITRYYVWSGSQLLCHIEADGTTRYYYADELGSTLALTDESGNVTDEFAYMPYGYATHTPHAGSSDTPFLWLGGYGVYYDSDTDLHLTLHRAYSSSMKRFISPDPLGIDGFANLYAYGDLNPLFGIDPTGLLTVFVHGTYSDSSTFNQSTRNSYAGTFNDQNQISFDWSGMNNTLARKIAGRRLASNINEYRQNYPNEPITIISHSHGGNVAIEASKRARIDNLVTLGTPARTFTHNPNESNIGEWYNVYSRGDKVQVSGGGLFHPFFQEAGPAGRTFNNANNIEVNHSAGWIQTHGDLTGSVGANAVRNSMRPAK